MNEKICRLCLQTISNYNCQIVEEHLLKYLKLNINISKENVMCVECASCLRVFSNFTPGYAYTEDKTLPLSGLDDGIKLEPEAIETTTNLKSLIKTELKCSFCTKADGREDLISLEESKEHKFVVNMLERYILETNLKNTRTQELLTCETCLESLEGVSSVILKCLEVEEKISKYIEIEGTDDKGQVELKKVRQFTFKPILKSEIELFGINELEGRSDQVQEEYTMKAEAEIKYEKEISNNVNNDLIIKTEHDITYEQNNFDIPDIKSKYCNGFQELVIENKNKGPTSRLLTCKNPSEIKMFKCEICPYETKRKCHFGQHLLIHKSLSEIKTFKCEICLFETKYKKNLEQHLLRHKSPSEIKMFKCEMCSYEARHKCSVKTHLLTHKSPAEIKMFKCALCSYEARQRSHLNSHLLTHKSPSEIEMFKCELCSFEARLKSHLKQHSLTHKNRSEIKLFKCYLCSYEAKQKGHLKTHLLTHTSRLKIERFKCEVCPYEAYRKDYFRRHLATHKSPSEVKMFKCVACSYEAKRKYNLKIHLLTHKSPSEIIMFKCALCSYETKRKSNLKSHLLTHKSPLKIETFKYEMYS